MYGSRWMWASTRNIGSLPISSASSEGSDEPVHTSDLLRAFASCIHKVGSLWFRWMFYLFACWVILHAFLTPAAFFLKIYFSKYSFMNKFRLSNSLDPDQARRFVGPGLDPNCLQRLLGWVVTWFLLGYTVRKNGQLLSTTMFSEAKVSRNFSLFLHLYPESYTPFSSPHSSRSNDARISS